MNQRWEINRVSTPERILDKIKTEMAQPVGIVIIGADSDFKNEIVEQMMSKLQGFTCCFTKTPDTVAIIKALRHRAMAVVLDSVESGMHDLRHELVKVMRNAGAKTVVGFYVKAQMPQPLPGRGFMSRPDLKLLRKTIQQLEANPPTADGLDYFITISAEQEA